MSVATNHIETGRSVPSPADVLARLYRDEPLFTAAGLFIALMIVPTLAAFVIDDRLFNGINVWDKVLKFEFALSVWLLTLAFFARFLPAGYTERRWYRIYAAVVIFCIAGEMAWIGGAAANGVGSHFNQSTPAMAVIYSIMGLFAVTLTSASLVYGIAIRKNAETGLSAAMHRVIWTSLVATFVLTIITAGTMSSGTGHWVGGTASDANGGFFFDWSRDGGDLRVAHFFATHVLHVVPLGAYAMQRMTGKLSVPMANLMVALYGAFVIFTFVQALTGKPFLPGII